MLSRMILPQTHELVNRDEMPSVSENEISSMNANLKQANSRIQGMSVSLRTASLAEVKREERSVVCSAEAIMTVPSAGQPLESSIPITYEVRAAIDQPGNIIIVADVAQVRRMARLLLSNAGD
jgi:hypothetical protein